ncbi:hypothetical protein RI129_000052 [Pyrocoelia pectoralis]|uniref:Senescence-associated protein n=1 Tax=Pyrocoelia pectoralis TaxID=417401 RepID=A0AAN7UZF1_9COLE
MIGRADIEGSKSDVAMNAWPPQASYPCGPAFAVPMLTEHRDQASICPFALREVSVLAELALGHLRYSLTDVPPQSNSPPDGVLESDRDLAWLRLSPTSGRDARARARSARVSGLGRAVPSAPCDATVVSRRPVTRRARCA